MPKVLSSALGGLKAARHARVALILTFWSFQFLVLTTQRTFRDSAHAAAFLPPRMLVTVFGVAASFGMAMALAKMPDRRWHVRLAAALGLGVAAALAHSAANFGIFQLFVGDINWQAATAANYAAATAQWLWTYMSLAMALVAMDYAFELHAARADLRDLRSSSAEPVPAADIWIRRQGGAVRLIVEDIDRISAEGQYIRIHKGERSYLHRASLATVLPALDPAQFIRVHRSHIVARRHVAALHRTRYGDYRVTTLAGEQLPVGRNYRSAARSIITA